MTSHGSVAAKVRALKEKYPEDYCSVPRCLWRVRTSKGFTPCRNHHDALPVATERKP